MKAIVIGAGSIGRRHAHNLNNIGVETRLIDINESNNICSILQDKFDMGFVCSPNVYHISHSIMLAERNIPVFCEKPFFPSPDYFLHFRHHDPQASWIWEKGRTPSCAEKP